MKTRKLLLEMKVLKLWSKKSTETYMEMSLNFGLEISKMNNWLTAIVEILTKCNIYFITVLTTGLLQKQV